jgi:hypothetical protein
MVTATEVIGVDYFIYITSRRLQHYCNPALGVLRQGVADCKGTSYVKRHTYPTLYIIISCSGQL